MNMRICLCHESSLAATATNPTTPELTYTATAAALTLQHHLTNPLHKNTIDCLSKQTVVNNMKQGKK